MINNVKETLTSLLKSIDSNKFTGNGDGIYLNTQIEISIFNKRATALVQAGIITDGDVIEISNKYKDEKMLEYRPPETKEKISNNCYDLDSQGRLHRKIEVTDEEVLMFSCKYDPNGRVSEVFFKQGNKPEQELHSYSYDTKGRISKHTDYMRNETTEYKYNKNGLLIQENNNNKKTRSYKYNKNGYLKAIKYNEKYIKMTEKYNSNLVENVWTEIKDLKPYNVDGSLNIENAIEAIKKVKQSNASFREKQWIMRTYLGNDVLSYYNSMCHSDMGYMLSNNTSVNFILKNELEKDTRKILEYTDKSGNTIAYDINGNEIKD